MPDPQQLLAFVAAGIVLNLTPGPDMLFMLGCTMRSGLRGGLTALLGISAGCLVHTALAAGGIAGLLAASPLAFHAVRLTGAVYLVYLGVATLLRGPAPTGAPEPADGSPGAPAPNARASHESAFWQGFLTNVFNPKVSLFFVAFLPQFIDPRGNAALQGLLLGLLFILNAGVVCSLIVWVAAHGAQRVRPLLDSAWLKRWLPGSLFCALGLRIALDRRV
jgi:threonine/homoserine/homoserine lactone efflux protein